MRRLVILLFAGLVELTTAHAQIPQAPDSMIFPSSASPASVTPVVELTQPTQVCDCFYTDIEFLLRWFKPVCASVPIVTIGNPNAPTPGALGQPGTQIVVGGLPPHKFEFPMTPGVQLKAGWTPADRGFALEVSGFIMEQVANSQHFSADANGAPYSYLPYQAPDNSFHALPFTIPGVVTGGSVAVGSTKVWGVESDLAIPFMVDRGGYALYASFLVGGRYLDLTDRVRITNALRLVADPSAVAIGADQFSTHNQFAGPQVGTTFGLARGRWSFEMTNKLAAGVTHQLRNIEGSPLLGASIESPLLVPGPLLALPSNIGRETASRVTLIPEIGVKTNLALTSWCSLSLGYSLLYWNKVLCPGDQMSPLVNITQVPFQGPASGPRDPKPLFNHTDYFAQGLSIGIQVRY